MGRHWFNISTRRSATSQRIGMTMFGVTTPCVTAVRQALEAVGFDCLVFHATGTGGQAMEKLVEAGLIQGVLDITTTEVADEIVGGILPCGPERFEAILKARIPFVLSLGALDMVNFGPLATVPEPFRNRRLHVHNAQVTLMRTTPEENRLFARFIALKLNSGSAPFHILIPERGLSAIDAAEPFNHFSTRKPACAAAVRRAGIVGFICPLASIDHSPSTSHSTTRLFATKRSVDAFLRLDRAKR